MLGKQKTFHWALAGPVERGSWIRGHQYCSRPQKIIELFNLTEAGLDEILGGEDWKPEYERADQ